MLCATVCCCREAFGPSLHMLCDGAQAGLEDWEIARIRVNMMVQPDMRVRFTRGLGRALCCVKCCLAVLNQESEHNSHVSLDPAPHVLTNLC